jgi:hypothetical protein
MRGHHEPVDFRGSAKSSGVGPRRVSVHGNLIAQRFELLVRVLRGRMESWLVYAKRIQSASALIGNLASDASRP